MNKAVIERTTERGYEELTYKADLNEFVINGITKSWTKIVTDGYDSEIVLANVSAKDIAAYRDEENNLYIGRKSAINYLLKEYGNGEIPEKGGVVLPLYDPAVVKVSLVDKKGVKTEIDIEGYIERTQEKEKKKVAAWTDMGFDDQALRLAYEKTVYKKQKMDWDYMNGILLGWHRKNLHTLAEIQAGDSPRRSAAQPAQPPMQAHPARPGEADQRVREDVERMREFLRREREKEGG